ncbi:hypothetical protein E4U58_000569, partial [Claviceps cyperi]
DVASITKHSLIPITSTSRENPADPTRSDQTKDQTKANRIKGAIAGGGTSRIQPDGSQAIG